MKYHFKGYNISFSRCLLSISQICLSACVLKFLKYASLLAFVSICFSYPTILPLAGRTHVNDSYCIPTIHTNLYVVYMCICIAYIYIYLYVCLDLCRLTQAYPFYIFFPNLRATFNTYFF